MTKKQMAKLPILGKKTKRITPSDLKGGVTGTKADVILTDDHERSKHDNHRNGGETIMLSYKLESGKKPGELDKIFEHKKWSDISPDDLPNRETITDHEMWNNLTSFSPREYAWAGTSYWNDEWGRLIILYAPAMSHAGGGYAIWTPYSRNDLQPLRTQYFSWIQCKHDFKHKQLGNCWHGYTCTKCGAAYDVDSSG